MQATEIVKALRCCAIADCEKCDGAGYDDKARCCTEALKLSAADRLEELLDRCARYAGEIAVLRARQRWIPVTERLPEKQQRVIVRCEIIGTTVGWIMFGGWVTDLGPGCGDVTHWMPMPPAPEVEL